MIANVVLLVISIAIGHSRASDPVIIVGGAVVVVLAPICSGPERGDEQHPGGGLVGLNVLDLT